VSIEMVCLPHLLLEPSEQRFSEPSSKALNLLADTISATAINEATLQPWPNLHIAEIIHCLVSKNC